MPMLPPSILQSKQWIFKKFHEWYLDACSKGIQFIQAKVPNIFGQGAFDLHVSFEDIHALYRLDRLGATMITVWSLMCYHSGSDKTTTYLNPTTISQVAMNAVLNKNNPLTVGNKKNMKKQMHKMVKQDREAIATYIGKRMFESKHINSVNAPYNFDNHWIAFDIDPTFGWVVILDSADRDPKTYRDFCDILDSSYKYYLKLGGEGNPKSKGKMNYRTHYKPNNNSEKHNFHLSDKTLYLIGTKLLRFIMREFIYPDGAYHDPESLVAQHPDLCDYIGKGRPKDIIKANNKAEQERQNAIDRQRSWTDNE